MALSKYTNVEDINARKTGTGQFLKQEDLFVISQDSSEASKFGECSSDVMEVTLYDTNGNILPQLGNKNVRYIQQVQINQYLIKTNTNELAIDVEKILHDSNYRNGIIKVNINFVRLKVGNETPYRKMWIQEISATRSEIRALPLVVQDNPNDTAQNNHEFNNFQDLNIDSKSYIQHLTKIVGLSDSEIQNNVKQYITNAFPNIEDAYNKFTNVLSDDFGIKLQGSTSEQSFENFTKDIFINFKSKVQQKISTMSSTECEYVSRKDLDEEVFSYLTDAFNYKSSNLQTRDLIIQPGQVINTEQASEIAFETANDINTNSVNKNVDEYSTVDLSSIKINTQNIDDFQLLQRQLFGAINTTSPTDGTTTGGTTTGGTTTGGSTTGGSTTGGTTTDSGTPAPTEQPITFAPPSNELLGLPEGSVLPPDLGIATGMLPPIEGTVLSGTSSPTNTPAPTTNTTNTIYTPDTKLITLGFSIVSETNGASSLKACTRYGTTSAKQFKIDSDTFASATQLRTSTDGYVTDGYYSDGTIFRQIIKKELGPVQDCIN